MSISEVTEEQKDLYNSVVSHPLQSYEWGEFREKTGIKVIRRGVFENGKLIDGFQLTIHKIPHTPWNIGYLPKGKLPTEETIKELKKIGNEENCIFIQIEPDIIRLPDTKYKILDTYFSPSAHPLFTKYTFLLDITKSEEELLKNMHPKTRYNIRVAQKHGVTVVEDNSEKAFSRYLQLNHETTTRQKFYAHTQKYHELMWDTLRIQNTKYKTLNTNELTAHLLTAKYQEKILATWIVFAFHDILYYPYGASSSEHREVMASNAMMWEAIRFGKKLRLKHFDMWGALGPTPQPNDPWLGFHRFKMGYGPTLTEYIGSYDLVLQPLLYQAYKISDKARWLYLRLRK